MDLAHRHRTAHRHAEQVLDDLATDGIIRRLTSPPHDPTICPTCAQVGVVRVLDRMLAAVGELCDLGAALGPELAGQLDRATVRLVEGLDRVTDLVDVDRRRLLEELLAR